MQALAILTLIQDVLKSAFFKVWGWLSKLSFGQLCFLALAIFALVQHFQLADARSDAAKWRKQFEKEHAARLADRKAYEDAQRQASDANKATVDRVKREQEKITDEVKSDYQRDVADLRRRMREQTAQGSAGGTNLSPLPDTSQGADGADKLCVPSERLLRAQEIELQLMRLQDWNARQSQLDPNK